MGWLRTLMSECDPRVTSFGALARDCLAHAEWPAGIQPKPRSLAALFSKLDRAIELEWLQDRPQVQLVLSKILKCGRSAIDTPLELHLKNADELAARWRFVDAPFARALELRDEALPPGIPSEVSEPRLWNRLWWSTRPGDPVGLVRHWLAARELARTRLVGVDSEELPLSGVWFVETVKPLGPDFARNHSGPLCVAAPEGSDLGPSFCRVESPPIEEYLPQLLHWLELRFPDDGHFEPAAALSWLQGPVSSGAIDSFGTALGLAGLLDEVGVKAVQDRPLEVLASQYVERRLTEASSEGSAEAQWLKQHGFDVLIGMAKRAIGDSSVPLSAARTQDDWFALVPAEFQRGVDAEWARMSLTRAGAPVTVEQLEKALSDIPPGAYRVIRALTASGLLQREPDGMFRFGPLWLLGGINARAYQGLLEASPFEWGEALLKPHSRPAMREKLLSRVLALDMRVFESLLEVEDDDSPVFIAAAETLFEVTGEAVLRGTELDPDVLSGLFELVSNCCLHVDQEPHPRLLIDADSGSYWLAVFVLGEFAELIAPLTSGKELNPWRHSTLPAYLESRLAKVVARLSALAEETTESHVKNGFELFARFYDAFVDQSRELLDNCSVFLPHRALRQQDLKLWDQLAKDMGGLNQATLLAENWPETARSVWQLWLAAHCPGDRNSCLHPQHAASKYFWPYLPRAASRQALSPEHPFATSPPYALLGEQSWQILLQASSSLTREACRSVPGNLAADAFRLALSTGAQDGLNELWERFSDQAVQLLADSMETNQPDLVKQLISSAPQRNTGTVIHLLKQQLAQDGLSSPITEIALAHAHHVVRARAPFWQESYSLLADIEQRKKRVTQARS